MKSEEYFSGKNIVKGFPSLTGRMQSEIFEEYVGDVRMG